MVEQEDKDDDMKNVVLEEIDGRLVGILIMRFAVMETCRTRNWKILHINSSEGDVFRAVMNKTISENQKRFTINKWGLRINMFRENGSSAC